MAKLGSILYASSFLFIAALIYTALVSVIYHSSPISHIRSRLGAVPLHAAPSGVLPDDPLDSPQQLHIYEHSTDRFAGSTNAESDTTSHPSPESINQPLPTQTSVPSKSITSPSQTRRHESGAAKSTFMERSSRPNREFSELPSACAPFMGPAIPRDRFVGSCLLRQFPDLDIPHNFTGRLDQLQVHLENEVANTVKQDYQGDMARVEAEEVALGSLWDRLHAKSSSDFGPRPPLTAPITRGAQRVLPITLVIPVRIGEVRDGCLADTATFLSQVVAVPDEIIVVVSHIDGSMRKPGQLEETLEIIHEINACVPGIEFVLRHAHHDAGSNRNVGAFLAKYPVVTAFDVDDVPHPSRYEQIYQAFTQHPDLEYLVTGFSHIHDWNLTMPEPLSTPPDTSVKLDWDYRTVEGVYQRVMRRVGPHGSYPWCGELKELGSAHNGWMSIRRTTWERHPFVRGYRGQDLKMFGSMVMGGYNVSALLDSLGYYRRRPKMCGSQSAPECPFPT